MSLSEIAALGPWFQNLHLPDGTQTLPNHRMGDFPASQWRQIAPHLPEDLTGWCVLEIGCNAGFYAFEMAKRGARVTGVDTDAHVLAQAHWAAKQFGLEAQVAFEQRQVYDLASTRETYDLVLCLGGTSHLRYPLLGLDIIARKVKKLLVFQTPPSAGDEATLRSCGLRVTGRPDAELFVCEPDPSGDRARHAAEFESATGLGARLTKTLHFRNCWVNTTLGYTETCFHDGTRVPAVPNDGDEYRGKAARYGYGDDVEGLSRDHEILHTFLAEALGYGASPTLWAVAHGQEGGVAPVWEQEEEEAWTLAFQVYLHGGPPTEPLRRLTDAGFDLETLREEARKLLR